MEICQKNLHYKINDEINVFFLGDIHEGSANHASKPFKRAIQYIVDTPDSYVIGMGDYADCITHRDKRFNPSEIDRSYSIRDLKDLPNIQMNRLAKQLDPIRDKFIAWLYGNHEEAFSKYNSFDPLAKLVYLMGSDAPRLGYTGVLRLGIIRQDNRKTPNYYFDIDLNHGEGGGGRREGYPINIVHDVFRWTSGDIKVMGHIHQMATDCKKFSFVDRNLNMKMQKVLYGSNGCFMYKRKEGTRGYFESKPGPYSGIGMLHLQIKVGHGKQDCRLNLIEREFD